MDNTSYIALSRQITLQRELDISANNLANMNTTGYKFEELLVSATPGAPAYDAPIRTPANFAYDNGVGRDFSQGTLNQTGAPLDLAINGEGAFFEVATASGNVYTRDGAFTLDASGTIVDQNGDALQGDGGPIVLDPKYGEPVISKDGIVTQTVNGQAQRVGKITLMRIANMSDLKKNGDGTYSLTSNQQPVPATDAQIEQGFVEASNVNPMKEVTHLIQINRAYQNLANIIEQNASLSQSAIQRLGKVA